MKRKSAAVAGYWFHFRVYGGLFRGHPYWVHCAPLSGWPERKGRTAECHTFDDAVAAWNQCLQEWGVIPTPTEVDFRDETGQHTVDELFGKVLVHQGVLL